MAFRAGTELSEHQNPGEATCLSPGGVGLRAGKESWQGKAGDLLIVPDGLHSLEAEEDSAILMTVAKIKTTAAAAGRRGQSGAIAGLDDRKEQKMTVIPFEEVPKTRRWWARGAYAAVFCAELVPLVAAGVAGTVALLLTGAGGVVVTVAGIYWFLISRGFCAGVRWRWRCSHRWWSGPLYSGGPAVGGRDRRGAGFVALVCARAALRESVRSKMTEYPAPAWQHPFLVMNPRSGGGKVVKFDLQREAEELGAEVALLEGPDRWTSKRWPGRPWNGGPICSASPVGTEPRRWCRHCGRAQPSVPGDQRRHPEPFRPDLGLDREDPTGCLDALRDGVELHVDLGKINGRTFVNNSSFGVYAEVVQSPEYRDDKTGTVLQMLPDLMRGAKGARLHAQYDGTGWTGRRRCW